VILSLRTFVGFDNRVKELDSDDYLVTLQ
jgi:hypothetical protein